MSRTCVQPAKPQLLSGCKGKWCFLNLQIFSKKFFHFFRPPVARKRTTEGKRFSVSTTLPIASEHSSLSLRTFAKQSVSFRLAGANIEIIILNFQIFPKHFFNTDPYFCRKYKTNRYKTVAYRTTFFLLFRTDYFATDRFRRRFPESPCHGHGDYVPNDE